MKTPEEAARELATTVLCGVMFLPELTSAIRARDAEWREAVEGVAKAELDAAKELLQHICDAPLKLELVTAERDQLRAEKLAR